MQTERDPQLEDLEADQADTVKGGRGFDHEPEPDVPDVDPGLGRPVR